MNRNQKHCKCGHVTATWDTHTDRCKTCCGCCRELPCGISKSWSPETWVKCQAARVYSGRKKTSKPRATGKTKGSVRDLQASTGTGGSVRDPPEGIRTAVTSQVTSTLGVASHLETLTVTNQGATSTLDIVSAVGQPPASTAGPPRTRSAEAMAVDRLPRAYRSSNSCHRSPARSPASGHRSAGYRAAVTR